MEYFSPKVPGGMFSRIIPPRWRDSVLASLWFVLSDIGVDLFSNLVMSRVDECHGVYVVYESASYSTELSINVIPIDIKITKVLRYLTIITYSVYVV